MSVESCLNLLADSSQRVSASALAELTDLASEEASLLGRRWPQLPVGRRRQVVEMLVDLAEDNIELSFGAVFRLCLNDADAEVRVWAIDGLFESNERSLIAPLTGLMRLDSDEGVRTAAAMALGRFSLMADLGELSPDDTARVDEALFAAIDDPQETADVRRRALESIGFRSLERVAELIKAAYYSDERLWRHSAIFAMGRSADLRWLPLLLTELKSDDTEARYEAALACGELEDERAVANLAALIDDEDIQVSLAAIETLGRIGGRLARQVLLKATTNPDERLAGAAREAMEDLGSGEGFTAFRFDD